MCLLKLLCGFFFRVFVWFCFWGGFAWFVFLFLFVDLIFFSRFLFQVFVVRVHVFFRGFARGSFPGSVTKAHRPPSKIQKSWNLEILIFKIIESGFYHTREIGGCHKLRAYILKDISAVDWRSEKDSDNSK